MWRLVIPYILAVLPPAQPAESDSEKEKKRGGKTHHYILLFRRILLCLFPSFILHCHTMKIFSVFTSLCFPGRIMLGVKSDSQFFRFCVSPAD